MKLDYIERECVKAQQITAYENTFKRLHLNIWTEQVSRWIRSRRGTPATSRRPSTSRA
jgi:hypothetical protein